MKKLLLSAMAILASASFAQAEVIFSEDFEWLAPWTDNTVQTEKPVSDTIGEDETKPGGSDARQLPTNKVDGKSTFEALLEKGYDFVVCAVNGKTARAKGEQVYLQRNYLKFGLTDQRAGLVLPLFDTDKAFENPTISFDWVTMRQGSGEWDKTKLVVIVENGDDKKVFDVAPLDLAGPVDGVKLPFAWYPTSVELKGATIKKDTKITIRPCDEQWETNPEKQDGTIRFFIDNIVITSEAAGVDAIEAENAPVEYFNLQGIRVENPVNGLFIARQGNKVTKVIK